LRLPATLRYHPGTESEVRSMTPTETRSIKELFRAWRSGDANAGQSMAQRFADWYYAIATSRLGEGRGRTPCETACQHFGEGIVEVTESRALVGWAHEIIQAEIAGAGARAEDGDEANAYTGQKKPKTLLRGARADLPEEVQLLEDLYSGNAEDDEITERARALGGMPLGVLKSRYRVKQWLRDNRNVPFEVAPDKPNLDRAPLPLYESGAMKTPKEEADFEQWMLTDLDLCKDIAEFAHFAIALRGGLGAALPEAKSVVPKELASGDAAPAASGSRKALGGVLVLGLGLVLLLVIAAALVAGWLLLM
jgi:hypothetical protein